MPAGGAWQEWRAVPAFIGSACGPNALTALQQRGPAEGYDAPFFPVPGVDFFASCRPSSSLVNLTFFTVSVLTFSFFTLTFFTFSFFTAGPASASLARRLA